MVPDVRWVHGRLWLVIGGTPESPTLLEYVPPPRPTRFPSPLLVGLGVLALCWLWLWLHRGDE